jgi:hypothetical protein
MKPNRQPGAVFDYRMPPKAAKAAKKDYEDLQKYFSECIIIPLTAA